MASAEVESETMQYKIQWNNYGKEMKAIIGNLFDTGEGSDVTLSLDGRGIKCHRFIIQACSGYLNDILSNNPPPPRENMIICMKLDGVNFNDLFDLVSFMYKGQINVPAERMPQFFKLAEQMQMKNLSNPSNVEWCSVPQAPHNGTSEDTRENQLSLLPSFPRKSVGESEMSGNAPISTTNSTLHPSCFEYPNPLSTLLSLPLFGGLFPFPPLPPPPSTTEQVDNAPEEPSLNENGFLKAESKVLRTKETRRSGCGDDNSLGNDPQFIHNTSNFKLLNPAFSGERMISGSDGEMRNHTLAETQPQPIYGNLQPKLKLKSKLKDAGTTGPLLIKRPRVTSADKENSKPGTPNENPPPANRGRPRGRPSVRPPALTEPLVLGPPKDSAEREERLKLATTLALSGAMSARQAAILYEIHRTTLYRYMKLHDVAMSQRKRKASCALENSEKDPPRSELELKEIKSSPVH